MFSPPRSRPAPASTSPAPRPPPPPPPPPGPPPSQLLIPAIHPPDPARCLGIPLRFQLVHPNIDVHGYQMYAVEKWLVERSRAVAVLLVYTGDPSHKARPLSFSSFVRSHSAQVSVFSIKPQSDLSPPDAHAEWRKALNHLRRDGARPKETPHGVLMATSLAHFRSDYTIVLIPDGNFLAVREQLYTNINLLRMGCFGRSALTLEDPSDATKSRFISTYRLPQSISHPVPSTENVPLTKTRSHSHSQSSSVLNFAKYTSENSATSSISVSKAKSPIGLGLPTTFGPPSLPKPKADNSVFIATVLELVKLIQAGLSLFGMYGVIPKTQIICPYLDGLLCDETVDGIRRWIVEIGEPCLGLEPMERIADPMFVAALVSLVLAVRNKLAAIGFSNLVPKDPFLQPHVFICALTAYVQTTNPASSNPTIASPHQEPLFLSPHSHLPGFGNIQGGTHMFPPSLYHFFPHSHPNSPPTLTPSTSGSSGSTAPASTPTSVPTVLTRELIDAIGLAYDGKGGTTDGRVGGGRVRRALREKLRAGIDSDTDVGPASAERGATSSGEGGGSGIGIVGGEHRDGKDRERGEREKETLGGVGTGVSSSGGQILSGIGSFASGLGLGVGPGASGASGAGAVMEATCDLGWLVRCVRSKDGKGKGKGRKAIGRRRERRRNEEDLLGVGLGYGYGYGGGKEKEKDGGVGLSVRALWSGQVNSIVKLREWEAEREKERGTNGSVADKKRRLERDRWALSDGEVDDSVGVLAKSETEEESDPVIQQGSFRGMWGERVQKKLGHWTGLHRRRGNTSLDLTTRGESGPDVSTQPDALATARPEMLRGKSTPALPPMVFSGADGEQDDDDLLSSGQVSPIDNLRPSPFSLLQDRRSLENTSLATSEYERKVTEFNQKRPWGNRLFQTRISSWADPFSARELLDDVGSDLDGSMRSRRQKRVITGSLLGGTSILSEAVSNTWDGSDGYESSQEDERPFRWKETLGQQRRRSFHDIDSLAGMRVMHIEHMRVDVELAGQLLIMSRREQHLQNVIACLQVITSTLSTTNTQLREDYTTHTPFISELDTHAQVISNIDIENAKADKTSQATNTLRYEAEQFRVPDLWHAAMPSRQKVLALREKVFGTGGRRLPAGVHGAHGKFNRLQWTLDGRERLVDHLGRTESEAEEEEPGVPYLGLQEEDEDEDVVQHPGIKPMWLLRFFTSWGARWGTFAAVSSQPQPSDEGSQQGTPQSTPHVNERNENTGHHPGLTRRGNKNPILDSPDTKDEAISPLSVSS
ncbi:hypothetical protein C0995_000468 [Termitomyces sp. Mi166|nr:hypothetical protein C0995_000468 [Termitomyces sp. Mi166\